MTEVQATKVLVYGATGMIGSRITAELVRRGHVVTAALRDPAKAAGLDPAVRSVVSDQNDLDSVVAAAQGQDLVVSATGAARDGSRPPADYLQTSQTFFDGLRKAGTTRVVLIGGAGSLEVAPGLALIDAPGFPPEYLAEASVHREVLGLLRASEGLDWTYVSPAAEIAPGERTGAYRKGGDQLLTNAEGHSTVSAEDFAIGVVDVIESGEDVGRRITIAS